jgi:mannose-6-phosphate isomerase-like protein (cupin superfamily)
MPSSTPPPESAPQAQVFRFHEVPDNPRGKTHIRLAQTDLIRGKIQVLRHGGENNLHAHLKSDGFWMVLEGRARFYTEGDVLVADLGPREGVLIPRGFKYWFEQTGDEPLQILQVHATVPSDDPTDRVAFGETTEAMRNSVHV